MSDFRSVIRNTASNLGKGANASAKELASLNNPYQNTIDSIYANKWGDENAVNIALGKEESTDPTFRSLHNAGEVTQNLNSPKDYIVSSDQDDGGATNALVNKKFTTEDVFTQAAFTSIRHYNGLYYSNEIDLYDQIYRFKIFNPDVAVSNFKEILFFTRPDLSILARNDNISNYPKINDPLNSALSGRPFWEELRDNMRNTVKMLQGSIDHFDPFNRLLQNTVTSSIEIPALESEAVETASNMYGVNLSYRGSSEGSDDSFSFSLEFRDTKWLDVYYFFRAYEEYETLKHHGIVRPWKPYIEQKILHDQFSIYKFLLDDDMETIRYYAKYYGVYPTSLPRDTFSTTDFNNGIVYNINFKAAFYEDMNPDILYDFNALTSSMWDNNPYDIEVYNSVLGRVDTRSAKIAKVVKYTSEANPKGFDYKLKWKGDKKV